MRSGYLGIDLGTQGLSVIVVSSDLHVIAAGEANYKMVADLPSGYYEQCPADWERALVQAMTELREKLAGRKLELEILGIGIAGQMHGEVLVDELDNTVPTAKLWCDSRNETEGLELTHHFGVKVPKRMTVARWLWTTRNQPQLARKICRLTTPAGWLAYRLSGEMKLGIGDASGMFPIDQATGNYDPHLLRLFDRHFPGTHGLTLFDMLPAVRLAGDDGGFLNETGSRLLGLPVGIPVAPAEGDQPASLAGSMIGTAGQIAVSFGTSVCANVIGDRPFHGVDQAIDHFCAPDGKPINMVFLRNGTTFMNTLIEMYASASGISCGDAMSQIMAQVLQTSADCGGIFAMPFTDDEPGLGVNFGGQGSLHGFSGTNATTGNVIKAALLATMFNLKLGIEVLDRQGFPRSELLMSGGLTKTPGMGQILADVMQTPVTVSTAAAEGCAFGAALLAMYRVKSIQESKSVPIWEAFLAELEQRGGLRFEPDSQQGSIYAKKMERYRELIQDLRSKI